MSPPSSSSFPPETKGWGVTEHTAATDSEPNPSPLPPGTFLVESGYVLGVARTVEICVPDRGAFPVERWRMIVRWVEPSPCRVAPGRSVLLCQSRPDGSSGGSNSITYPLSTRRTPISPLERRHSTPNVRYRLDRTVTFFNGLSIHFGCIIWTRPIGDPGSTHPIYGERTGDTAGARCVFQSKQGGTTNE